jgi:CHAT domain
MPIIQINSPDWSVLHAPASRRRSRSAARASAASFPPEFLTEESEVDEFVAQPKPATRGRPGGPGALDFSCDLGPGEAAIVSVRHPSGALTFHVPVPSTGRGARHGNRVRFVVTVRSTNAATRTRGVISEAITVTVIKVAQAGGDKAVSLLLPRLVAAFEKNTWSKRGLKEGWLKVTAEALGTGRLASGRPSSGDRSLLLIHGIFSNAAAAYGPLSTSNFFERMKGAYGDRIYAFDHFSLSRTPAENARMLLEGLPGQTTTFDVVTHSRGGLVLRNLVERADALGPLADRFRLGHAVLVACPNAGTPLATPERWSDTVGWLANLLELFPDNPFSTGAAFVANGLVWLARHAAGDIPGLHAMDSAGDLIADLQSPPGPPKDAYSALVANYNPAGEVLLRMLDTGVDQFFGSANDLVVPSEGGWRIDQPGSSHLAATRIGCFGPGGNLAGDAVTHFNFFSRPETIDFLVRALSGDAQPLRRLDPSKMLPDHRVLRERAPARLPAAAAAAAVATPQAPPRPAERVVEAMPERGAGSLRVTVVNGDLTFEQAPILLGHYRATRLTGTERVMNDFIGGAMEQSLQMGLYPLGPGTHQIFVNTRCDPESPRRLPRPKAVVVVGLGEEGKLNAADLVHTVRQAVIAWAQRSSEQDGSPPESIELAATLIGSGGTGITAGQAAQRIAQGVHEANALLGAGDDGRRWPRVGHLRLIELYLDRATEAWRALKMQAAATPERYDITDQVAIGIGPLPRPVESGYRGADYDFITAEAERGEHGQTRIKYTLDTRRARSEVRAQHTQSSLLRDLVANASNAESNDQIGRTLFKLLVPVEMEPFLAGAGEMQIELVPETAGIPWELLDTDRGDHDADRRPWAIRSKLLRKLRTQEFRNDVRDADPNSSVLIIGEPECPPRYPRLYGARMEAQEVHACLVGPNALAAERVKALLGESDDHPGPNARTVIDALLERPWRIVHIAGHGALPTEGGAKGGVVLSNDTFLGPDEIATMRVVPELVFVNCCHLAARNVEQLLAADAPSGYDRVHFASGVAEELIKIGVKCVIAAGWAVNDEAAATFARTFYGSLLRGSRFITAVAEAREAAYDTTNNTWAAYQCYGDPDWVLRRDLGDANAPSARKDDEFAAVASAAALKLALETIVVQTKFQRYKPQTQLERVRALEERFGARWGHLGEVADLFGEASLAARDLEAAIRWYERAVSAGDGTAPIKAAEQLANVRIRLGAETVERAEKERNAAAALLKKAARGRRVADRKARAAARRALDGAAQALRKSLAAARGEIKNGIATLDRLSNLQPTMERESLRGSAHKRLALVAAVAGQAAEERRAIEAAKRHYAQAVAIGREAGAASVFYPGLNYLAAELALNAGRRGRRRPDQTIVEATRTSLENRVSADPDFWSIVGQAELQLYMVLGDGRKLASARESLERTYAELHDRVPAPWLWASAYDTAAFVLRRYAARAPAPEARAATALLEKLAGFAGIEGGES